MIPAELSPDIAAMIDKERTRIEEVYGNEVSQAVAHIMHGVLMSVFLYAQSEDLSPVAIMRALSESIIAINKLSHEYKERASKAGLN